jgi:hypothetical protein
LKFNELFIKINLRISTIKSKKNNDPKKEYIYIYNPKKKKINFVGRIKVHPRNEKKKKTEKVSEWALQIALSSVGLSEAPAPKLLE